MLTINPAYPKVVQEIHSTIIKSDIGTKMRTDTKGIDLLNTGFSSAQGAFRMDSKILNEFEEVNRILKNQYLYVNFQVLDDICNRYGLVPSPIADFTGFVPKKNLEEFKAFQEKIAPHLPKSSVGYSILCPQADTTYNLMEKMIDMERREKEERENRFRAEQDRINEERKRSEKQAQRNAQREVEDPIVLYPLKRGAIIITAWGDEASDPAISNFNFN